MTNTEAGLQPDRAEGSVRRAVVLATRPCCVRTLMWPGGSPSCRRAFLALEISLVLVRANTLPQGPARTFSRLAVAPETKLIVLVGQSRIVDFALDRVMTPYDRCPNQLLIANAGHPLHGEFRSFRSCGRAAARRRSSAAMRSRYPPGPRSPAGPRGIPPRKLRSHRAPRRRDNLGVAQFIGYAADLKIIFDALVRAKSRFARRRWPKEWF